jgi:hypothetical protein
MPRRPPAVLTAVAVAVFGIALSVLPPAASASSPAVTRFTAARADGPAVYVIRRGASPCEPLTKTVSGTIQGIDRRFANAMINMNILDATGRGIDGNGCVGSATYGISVHVNYFLPPSGAAPGTAAAQRAVTRWSATFPDNAAKVYVEAYPNRAVSDPMNGVTDHSHFGFTERPSLRLGGSTIPPVNLAFPVANCSLVHAAGTIAGRFLSGGRPVTGMRVSAFSAAKPPADPMVSGPLGLGFWNGSATSYRIPLLASGSGKGQPYTVIAKLADGRSKTFSMTAYGKAKTGVRPCRTLTYDLRF